MTLTTVPNLFFVLGLPAMLLGGVVLVGFVVRARSVCDRMAIDHVYSY
jgi:hypothetical protein